MFADEPEPQDGIGTLAMIVIAFLVVGVTILACMAMSG